MTIPLAPPAPSGDPARDKWLYQLWARSTGTGTNPWTGISFTGSNLTDIATRNHADLQNINTATYTHLSSTNATDLTDAGDTTLHYHSADRNSANFTGTNWTDLTDAGATTLHKHDHAGQDNLNSASYTHLTATDHTDLTDGGLTTLHAHAGATTQDFSAKILTISDTKMMATATTFTDGAAAAAGTLLNAPAAGNPTKWIPIDDNGTTRYIPAW